MSTAGWTEINVALPLPMDVASTLMILIGTAYPSAVIDTTDGLGRYGLSVKIDPKERAKKVTKKAAAEAKSHRDDEADDTGFLGFRDGSVILETPQELSLHLGSIAHQIFTATDGAFNYVNWEVRTEEGDRYVLTIAKSPEQRPADILASVRKVVDEIGAERSPDVGYTARILDRLNTALRRQEQR